MPNPLQISDAVDLTDLAIQDIWLKGSEQETRIFEQFYNVESVTDYLVKDSSLSGLGYAGRVVENAAITSQSPVQGFDRTFTQVQHGVILSFSKMMWMFGIKKRNLEQITQEARRACSDLRELRLHERLDNAFSAVYTADDVSGNYSVSNTGGNSVRLCSNAQTREDSGTNNNNTVNRMPSLRYIQNLSVKLLLNTLESLKMLTTYITMMYDSSIWNKHTRQPEASIVL